MLNTILNQNFRIEEIFVDTMDDFERLLESSEADYYRGEENSNWTLNSSFIRKTMAKKNHQDLIIDYNFLKTETNEYFQSYKNCISDRHSFVRFLYYLQHSISFSPFIDITADLWVAVSFCLQNIQTIPEARIENSGAIYTFSFFDKKKILSSHSSVESALKNLSIGINRQNPLKKTVEAYILKNSDLTMLNDRMQYQKGAFLLLNNYSLNQQYQSHQMHTNFDLEIKKYILSENLLKELFFKLKDFHNEYLVNYLYNPYLFLEKIKI